jgi:hypothetical protein
MLKSHLGLHFMSAIISATQYSLLSGPKMRPWGLAFGQEQEESEQGDD